MIIDQYSYCIKNSYPHHMIRCQNEMIFFLFVKFPVEFKEKSNSKGKEKNFFFILINLKQPIVDFIPFIDPSCRHFSPLSSYKYTHFSFLPNTMYTKYIYTNEKEKNSKKREKERGKTYKKFSDPDMRNSMYCMFVKISKT